MKAGTLGFLSRRTRSVVTLGAFATLLLVGACGVDSADSAEAAVAEAPQMAAFDADAEIAKWVALWASYDLNGLDDLFVGDSRLTYFSSETAGMMSGGSFLREHHAGFGFVEGGTEPAQLIWVDEVHSTDLGGGAHVVGAIWYFGDPENPSEAGHGPMTVVYIPDGDGYKVTHMHFANYE